MGFRTAPSGPQKPKVLSPLGGWGEAEGDTEKRQAEAGGGSDEFRPGRIELKVPRKVPRSGARQDRCSRAWKSSYPAEKTPGIKRRVFC